MRTLSEARALTANEDAGTQPETAANVTESLAAEDEVDDDDDSSAGKGTDDLETVRHCMVEDGDAADATW